MDGFAGYKEVGREGDFDATFGVRGVVFPAVANGVVAFGDDQGAGRCQGKFVDGVSELGREVLEAEWWAVVDEVLVAQVRAASLWYG